MAGADQAPEGAALQAELEAERAEKRELVAQAEAARRSCRAARRGERRLEAELEGVAAQLRGHSLMAAELDWHRRRAPEQEALVAALRAEIDALKAAPTPRAMAVDAGVRYPRDPASILPVLRRLRRLRRLVALARAHPGQGLDGDESHVTVA